MSVRIDNQKAESKAGDKPPETYHPSVPATGHNRPAENAVEIGSTRAELSLNPATAGLIEFR